MLDIVQSENLLVGIAAIWTATIATIGLGTWRSRLRDHTRYETTLRLLQAIHNLERVIRQARYEALFPKPGLEMSLSPAYCNSLQSNLEQILFALGKLETAQVDAEAIWGKDFEALLHGLVDCATQVSQKHSLFLRALHPENSPETKRQNFEKIENDSEAIGVMLDYPAPENLDCKKSDDFAIKASEHSQAFTEKLGSASKRSSEKMRSLIAYARAPWYQKLPHWFEHYVTSHH